MVLVLQAQLGTREMDNAILVRLQPVPLHEHIIYRHHNVKRHELLRGAAAASLEMADCGYHGEHRCNGPQMF